MFVPDEGKYTSFFFRNIIGKKNFSLKRLDEVKHTSFFLSNITGEVKKKFYVMET